MLSSILSALLLATSALALAARDNVVDARPKIFILAADGVKIQGTGTEGFDGCGGGWAVEYSENELQKTFTMQTFFPGELKCFGVPIHTFDCVVGIDSYDTYHATGGNKILDVLRDDPYVKITYFAGQADPGAWIKCDDSRTGGTNTLTAKAYATSAPFATRR